MAALGWILNLGFAGGGTAPTVVTEVTSTGVRTQTPTGGEPVRRQADDAGEPVRRQAGSFSDVEPVRRQE